MSDKNSRTHTTQISSQKLPVKASLMIMVLDLVVLLCILLTIYAAMGAPIVSTPILCRHPQRYVAVQNFVNRLHVLLQHFEKDL